MTDFTLAAANNSGLAFAALGLISFSALAIVGLGIAWAYDVADAPRARRGAITGGARR